MKLLLLYCVPLALAQAETCPRNEIFKVDSKKEKFCVGSWDKTTKVLGGDCVEDCALWGSQFCNKTGQVWTDCMSCVQNCGDPKICFKYAEGKCPGGCKCPDGFQWHVEKQQCMDAAKCHVCAPNSSWNECGSACQPTCQNPFIPETCSKECVPRCECEDQCMVINEENGQCTNVKECPTSRCGANETWNNCATAAKCEKTCQNASLVVACPKDNKICVSRCQCSDGFIRDEKNGECVTKTECPVNVTCGEHQELVQCPLCKKRCGHLDKCLSFKCSFGIDCDCPVEPRCECVKGFQEDPLDPSRCLPDSMCGICMNPHQVWNPCSSGCDETCQNKHDTNIICDPQCIPRCECESGFLKDERTGDCISAKQCPTPSCGRNEVWNDCMWQVERTCLQVKGRKRRQIAPNEELASDDSHEQVVEGLDECPSRGCQCFQGYVRFEGNCIPEENCPTICPDNEHWKLCGYACGPQCQFPRPVCSDQWCSSGCFCNTGFLRDSSGNCQPKETCQTKMCAPNEAWKTCGRKCEPSCTVPMPSCTKNCVPAKCECMDGFLRNESGVCIRETSCPAKTIECDNISEYNTNTGQYECITGYQKHRNGKCYAFLSSSNICNPADLPFMSNFVAKKCSEGIKANGKCKIVCRYDTKARSKMLPKATWLGCKEAVDGNGDVIGLEFNYKGDYTNYENLCGKGCNLQKLREPELMGPTAESTNCDADANGDIVFGGPKTCKMQCKKTNDEGWLAVKKPFKCLCKDNITSDGRICQWRFLDENPAKAFDKKFLKLQKTDAKCLIHF